MRQGEREREREEFERGREETKRERKREWVEKKSKVCFFWIRFFDLVKRVGERIFCDARER